MNDPIKYADCNAPDVILGNLGSSRNITKDFIFISNRTYSSVSCLINY